jgi:hypothetical protein
MVAQLEFVPTDTALLVAAPASRGADATPAASVASPTPASGRDAEPRAPKPRVVIHLEPSAARFDDEPEPAPTETLTKARLVERIIELNPTASEAFLRVFSHRRLMDYFEHLASAQEPRGKHSSWLRRGDSPAIVAREPRDD